MWQSIIGGVIGKIADIVDQYVEDKDKALELKTQIEKEILKYNSQLLQSQRDIIVAEAKSESWLTRNWRPITMIIFTGLIVADWLGYSAPNLTPEEKIKLFDIIQMGLGGYVIGRSIEKVVREIKEPVKKIVENKVKKKKIGEFNDEDIF